MAMVSLGDLSAQAVLRNKNTVLKQEIASLSTALATGEAPDKARHLGGDYALLADLAHGLRQNAAHTQALAEAQLTASAMQGALSAMQDAGDQLANGLLMLKDSGFAQSASLVAGTARDVLQSVMGALDTQVAGRRVFAGTDVARPPLPDVDALLASLRPAIAGLQTPQEVITAISQQLEGVLAADAPPGYLVSEGVSLQLNITTATPEISAFLAPIAMAALAPETPESAQDNMRFAADRLLGARAGITGLQATLGITEGSAERMASRLAAQAMAAQTAQSQLVSVDPYDTATRLERAQFNLETLYAVTVRMSRLSLTEYL